VSTSCRTSFRVAVLTLQRAHITSSDVPRLLRRHDSGDDVPIHLYDPSPRLIFCTGVVSRLGLLSQRSASHLGQDEAHRVRCPDRLLKDRLCRSRTIVEPHHRGTRYPSSIHNTSPCTTSRSRGHSSPCITCRGSTVLSSTRTADTIHRRHAQRRTTFSVRLRSACLSSCLTVLWAACSSRKSIKDIEGDGGRGSR